MKRATLRSLGWSLVVLTGSTLGCAQLLGLDDFKDECPEVAEGKPCPTTVELCSPGETATCYSGPKGTEDRGACRSGTKTCGNNGLFGECEGEKTPGAEVCGNGLDEDCSGEADDGCPCEVGKSYPCYSGDEATQDVGACKTGKHVCQKDAMSFGACEGEVTPAKEDFEATGDEDCNGSPSADTEWLVFLQPEDEALDGVFVTTVANDGKDVLVAGAFSGTMTVGSKTATATGVEADGFLVKLDGKTGDTIWLKSYPNVIFGSLLSTPGLAFDATTGHTLVLGNAELSGIDFGTPSSPHAAGPMVVAFDGDGDPVWSTGCTGGTELGALGLGVDGEGNVVIGGRLTGTVTCGTKSATSPSATNTAIFLASFDSAGKPSWVNAWGSNTANDQDLRALAVAPDGGIWLTGAARGVWNFGAHQVFCAGSGTSSDILLAKVDKIGDAKFAEVYGGTSYESGSTLALDAEGNLYLGANNQGSIDFGGGEMPNVGEYDLALGAFDTGAGHLWSENFGADKADVFAEGLGPQPGGDLIILGSISGALNLGAGPFLSGKATYAFLARFEPRPSPQTPKLVWAKYYGGDKIDDGAAVFAAGMTLLPRPGSPANRDIVIGGRHTNPADFGKGMEGGSNSGFVMKVAP